MITLCGRKQPPAHPAPLPLSQYWSLLYIAILLITPYPPRFSLGWGAGRRSMIISTTPMITISTVSICDSPMTFKCTVTHMVTN